MRAYEQSPRRAEAPDGRRSPRRGGDRPVVRAVPLVAAAGGPSSAAGLLALQRIVGNAAVARLFESGRHVHDDSGGRDQAVPCDTGQPGPVQRSAVHDVVRSAGRPLARGLRAEMEARLGADFSDVRLHTDAAGHTAAESVRAEAFTSGSHIAFRRGGFDPSTAAGKHTLAHELTHVVQQPSGPVAGTDMGGGLRVSDPSDRYEREAEATATRVMAAEPGTVTRPEAAGHPTPAPPAAGSSAAVQRWAWVAGARVDPADPGLDDQMRTLAGDNLVHDYEDWEEFGDHATGNTDHLGNLPLSSPEAGTWVRFTQRGMNVLGENHTQVTLEHVMAAVGSTSFIYEPFAVDEMPEGSAMKAAYEADNRERFERFGVGDVADKRPFGAESLFPKMGFGLDILLPYLRGEKDMTDLKSGSYVGQPVQRYLKIAWAHAKDELARAEDLRRQKQPVPPVLAELAQVVKDTMSKLDPFITGLSTDGYLGDALDDSNKPKKTAETARNTLGRVIPALKSKKQALQAFVPKFLNAMRERARTDNGLREDERDSLDQMPRNKDGNMFNRWRDMHFAHAVSAAAARGVRYAGVGNKHLAVLVDNNLLPPNSSHYDMSAGDLGRFVSKTERLRDEATAGTAGP